MVSLLSRQWRTAAVNRNASGTGRLDDTDGDGVEHAAGVKSGQQRRGTIGSDSRQQAAGRLGIAKQQPLFFVAVLVVADPIAEKPVIGMSATRSNALLHILPRGGQHGHTVEKDPCPDAAGGHDVPQMSQQTKTRYVRERVHAPL